MISKQTIEEILARTNIEPLISGYVSLKRAGDTYKGLCPFHSEKSPSFTVYPKTESFYCFGCGIGGDAVTFIKQIEHLDYPDALEFLAKRAGITIMEDNDKYFRRENRVDRDRVFKMNVDAANFFHRCLMADNPSARAALSYFTEKRGLSLSTIKHFGLGYAPDSFDQLMNYMTSKGYTKDELVQGFLCGKSDKGTYYDAFRNRVIFPIIDVSGNVIAFGGRAMDNETKPKYKNSSDTPVYKKTRHVYALNFARHSCAETLILCEGYMDVIAMHAAGFTNAIATLGTAITSDQARLMSRYTKRVIICYDSDEAGQKAAVKALRVIGEVGLEARVVSVPGSKDPDEYIKTFGKEKFAEVLNGAKIEFEYKMESILARHDINLPQERIRALASLENEISAVYSEAERDVYIQMVATKLGVEPKSIRTDVARIIAKNVRAQRQGESQKAHRTAMGYMDKVNPDFAKAPTVAKHEEAVLGLLLIYPEHRKKVFDGGFLSQDDFFTELGQRIFAYIESAYRSGDVFTDLNEVFSPEEVGRITKMKLTRMNLTDNGDTVLLESINALKGSMQKKKAETASSCEDLSALIARLRSTQE
ncbi:MAG: DNA primase [Ruminococcaceae bacterium]|nr:DNA primase [Oscillospiraceae bacterium]